MSYKVTKIKPCGSLWGDFDNCICGMEIFINGVGQGTHGCIVDGYFPHSEILFDTHEVVLAVSVCFQSRGGYTVLNNWIIETNQRVIGPMGRECSSYYPTVVGHTLIGIAGSTGYCMTGMVVHFNRCAP